MKRRSIWVFFALLLATIHSVAAIKDARAEPGDPGDKYEVLIQHRGKPVLMTKAAGHAWAKGQVTGRPSQCPPRRWCGCWLGDRYGKADKRLWNARQWAKEGRPATPGCIGCVAVLTRGRGGHVGEVQGYDRGNPIILSGNPIGVRTYSRARVIAYRWV